MNVSENLRSPIKGMAPISEEQAEELFRKAHDNVSGRLTARPGEDQSSLDALQGMRRLQKYRILSITLQIRNERMHGLTNVIQ